MKRITVTVLLVGGLMSAIAIGQGVMPLSKKSDFKSPFRYVIIAGTSDLQIRRNDNSDDLHMEVLLEDRAFNEDNLKSLFRMLNNRFSARPFLSIDLYTSLEAIKTPEEYDRSDLVGPTETFRRYKYAFFSRTRDGASFVYGIPGKVDWKRIELD